jgi:hypothetical protein
MAIKIGNVGDKFVAFDSAGNPLQIGDSGGGISLTLIADASDNLKAYALTVIPDDWQNAQYTLKALHIGQGVTSIGDTAFSECSGFTGSLTIPDSVTIIGSGAFTDCLGFTGNLTIPNSVATIGNFAFFECFGLTSANIRTTLTVVNGGTECLLGTDITTIHALASDGTWTAGSGLTIGGKTGITVIKDL